VRVENKGEACECAFELSWYLRNKACYFSIKALVFINNTGKVKRERLIFYRCGFNSKLLGMKNMSISIRLLGELTVFRNGHLVKLPTSKRTRALLAYLAITARPHRRDRLCEIFWEIPDDPRGALRWSLSKIRPLVNDKGFERLIADRERVSFLVTEIKTDVNELVDKIDNQELSALELKEIEQKLQKTLLEGIELPNQPLFQQWLTGERQEINRLRGKILARLSFKNEINLSERLKWIQTWLEVEPFNPKAATHLLVTLEQMGRTDEVAGLTLEFSKRFRHAGITWSALTRSENFDHKNEKEEKVVLREILARQKVQFCSAIDGTRIAYASVGNGSPIIKAANWLSHLEHDWDAPTWSPLFRDLALDHHFVRYDERGNGLSDWNVANISFEAFVSDLETVVEASKIEQFSLLGISQGAAVSIEYAIRHPERVKHLILFGGYAAGWRIDASEELIKEREAVMTLTALGWGKDNPVYRQIFSSTFMPGATTDELNWFNDFQRLTTSPENAVRFLSVFSTIDVRDKLAKIKVPTLVIHSLGDRRIPVSVGRDIAASIPGAEFVGLESDGHLLLGREAASKVFVETVRDFIARN
jgi:pimeloyl-ACP methyl ester carboxylesterase/DNA-binding SARP family transcriptional activator